MINEAGQARVGMLEPAKSIWGSDLKNLGIGDKSYDCGAENKLTCIRGKHQSVAIEGSTGIDCMR